MKEMALGIITERYRELVEYVKRKGSWEEATAFLIARILKILVSYVLLPVLAVMIYSAISLYEEVKMRVKSQDLSVEEMLNVIKQKYKTVREVCSDFSAEDLRKVGLFLGFGKKEKLAQTILEELDIKEEEEEEKEKEEEEELISFNYEELKRECLEYLKEHPEEKEEFLFEINPYEEKKEIEEILTNFFELREAFDFDELKSAYKKAVKRMHPDIGGKEEDFKKVTVVYKRLVGSFLSGVSIMMSEEQQKALYEEHLVDTFKPI